MRMNFKGLRVIGDAFLAKVKYLTQGTSNVDFYNSQYSLICSNIFFTGRHDLLSDHSQTKLTMADSDDEYEIPLRDQRYFGAGLKRKRVHFVPSLDSGSNTAGISPQGSSGQTASERYLSIVFKRARSEAISSALPSSDDTEANAVVDQQIADSLSGLTCEVCQLPIRSSDKSNDHQTSLAHQVCLPHSHPPSALDRKRKGISILQAYGWDPDKRLGLGSSGEGILHPVKPKEKRDTIGLGVDTEDPERSTGKQRRGHESKKALTNLDAGKIQRMDVESRKRDERLRQMFYSNDEVEKYLGAG